MLYAEWTYSNVTVNSDITEEEQQEIISDLISTQLDIYGKVLKYFVSTSFDQS